MQAAQKSEQKIRILVVEDHEFIRRLMVEALGKNHEIYTASNVKQGWKLYRQHTPDIVFLDIQLPDGSGHDLARRIKERQPYAYVVMATASDGNDDKTEAASNLADGFMTKPFHKDVITAHIQKCRAARRV